MKMHQWVGMAVGVSALSGGVILLSTGESLAAKAPAAGVAGKVTFLKGAAQHGAAEKGPFKPLKRNDSVREGEFIKTAAGSMLEVKLADGSIMRLAPNSQLKVGLATAGAEADKNQGQHKLTAGKMWAKITKSIGNESKFSVRTENAVAGVRGTTFRVNAEEDGSTVVKVYEGAVAVSNGPLVEKAASGEKKGPIDFKNRKQVEGPKEVTLQEWEKICGKMMGIKVAANGEQAEPAAFTAENDAANAEDSEWVAWNTTKDTEGPEGDKAQ